MRHERTLHCYGDEWQHLNRKIVSERRQILTVMTNFLDAKFFAVHIQKLDAKPFNACNLSADLLKYMTKRYSETEKAR